MYRHIIRSSNNNRKYSKGTKITGILSWQYRITRRQISSCIWKLKSILSEEEIQLLEQYFAIFLSLKSFYKTVQNFRKACKECDYHTFLVRLKQQLSSINNYLYRYALRIQSDLQAIKAAFLTPYSNGLIEGHVHRLKLIKRMMYGRTNLDLLEKRVLYDL
ncbi:transposase [Faecalibacterium prausnitzii]